MIGDRFSSDIGPARLLGSKTIRVAGVRGAAVAKGFLRRARSDLEQSCRGGARGLIKKQPFRSDPRQPRWIYRTRS
jgi:FMN phosphatase YigB (HAD superfamily)